MLDVTSEQNKKFCKKQEISYECFYGLKYGSLPWHASLNRIVKLKELLDSGFDGWFVYADADSYVLDLDYDLKAYLASKAHLSLIAATGGDGRHLAVNDGVFFINMSHKDSKIIASEWYSQMLKKMPIESINIEVDWDNSDIEVNDQNLLHDVLFANDSCMNTSVLVLDEGLINYNGSFIRQALRAYYGSVDARIAAIRADIG